MNSDKNEEPKLPDGWMLCTSKSNPGRKYYFNKKTGKSSWTVPVAEEKSCKKEQWKQRCKKYKKYSQEKRKVEVAEVKGLKRKSNGNEDSPNKKRQKDEATPEQNVYDIHKKPSPQKPKTESPVKRYEDPRNRASVTPSPNNRISHFRDHVDGEVQRQNDTEKSPVKNNILTPPLKTNIANNRLSHLREQLNAEVESQRQNDAVSPSKRLRISPKTPQKDTKLQKLDIKSPSLNESKSSTAQSPSSDSLTSVPSPSQFFAANKIISSMKAQLPEKFCNKSIPKDTFADIEEGICNQITEYPFMKHPATPPQFSEASKLVSAIKSKLTYKVVSKDVNLRTFSSAKDRMESLRSRLSSEAEEINHVITDKEVLSRIELPPQEAMEVEDSKEVKQHNVSQHNSSSAQPAKENERIIENVVLVVDTNIFIHELDVIKNVINSHIKGYSEQPTLLVPWRVINELDRLKDNNNGNGAICKRARSAMDYLYKSLPENNRIKGQSLRDANSHIYPCESPDDEILNCCLQQAERGKSVILLSNDKNLCSKASINGVRCIGLDELKPLLENKPQPTPDPDLHASVKHYENTMYHLLANILENEMRAKYNNLWQHVVFKAPPWSFSDVLQCLLKHWIAVFNEVFPRIEHLITDMKNTHASVVNKDPKSLSQSEVSSFKELCLEVAKKCQIIPEYMELAKITAERLQSKRSCENKNGGELIVIDAFEALWTVFSSYCAKLSTCLGIPHSLEDKLPSNDTLPELTSKWPMFSSQLRELAAAMKASLNVDISDPANDEHLVHLETVFKESLVMISFDVSDISKENIRVFCLNCRNMLQEAQSKFAELTILLDVCRNNIANQ